MRRRGLVGGAAMALLHARPAAPQGRDLTVVSWGGTYQDIQRDVFFRPWMTSRGQRMLEETWHGGLPVLRERATSGANTWDVVLVEGAELLIGCAEGLFEPLDWDAIGGRDAYMPEAVAECGVGAAIHATVLAWDRDRLRTAPRGWADLFDIARFPGRRALRRGPKFNLEIALLADGVAAAQVYALLATGAGVERALRRLDTIRHDLVWWERGSQPPQWLAAGEVVLAAADNGRVAAANAEDGRDLGMVWDGNLSWMDFWAIMRGTPNRPRAQDFLNLAGQAAVQATLPARMPYGVTARGAMAALPSPVLATLPTAPARAAAALPVDDRFWSTRMEPLTRRFEEWMHR